jgi:hypothetical protein
VPLPESGQRARPAIWPFGAWAVVGAGACLALLTAFTIGIFVLPLVIAATAALLGWRVSRTVAAVGVVSGLGLVPLYVAYLNRDGPGEICSTTSQGQECTTAWSPWPWLVAGLLLVGAGIVVFAALRSGFSLRAAGPSRRRLPPGRS